MLKIARQSLLPLALAGLLPAGLLADTASDLYSVGAAHYDQARWDLASDQLGDFVAQYARHARGSDAQFDRAEALTQLQRFDQRRDRQAHRETLRNEVISLRRRRRPPTRGAMG